MVILRAIFCAWAAVIVIAARADSFTVCTYNVENYCLQDRPSRPIKKEDSRKAVQKTLLSIHADVVALEEVCDLDALQEIRNSLAAGGVDYPHWEFVEGPDPYIHVAVLSRFPIIARRSHTNEAFLLNGRRHAVSRGFAEVDIRVRTNYSFTLFAAHLKSKRVAASANEADLREEEALLLREFIDQRLNSNPNAKLAVVGDFNDTKDSLAMRTVLGRGNLTLVDTRPAEIPAGKASSNRARNALREVTWTEYFAKEDLYTRIDYILLSKGMAREWDAAHTKIHLEPDWGTASDHRPLVATFLTEDR